MPEDVNPYNAGVPSDPMAGASAQAYPLSVGFEMEPEDVAAVFRSKQALRPYLRQRRMLAYRLMILGLLVAASGLLVPWRIFDRFWDMVLAIVASVLMVRGGYLLAFGAASLRRALTRSIVRNYQEPRNARLLGRRDASIDAAGIRQSAPLFEASWQWKAVEQIEAVPDYLLFHIGSVQSLVIPQRAFSSAAHYQAFLAAAREFHQRATFL